MAHHHHHHQHQHCHAFPVAEQPASSEPPASGSTQQQPGFVIPSPFAGPGPGPGLLHHHQGFVPYTFQLSAAAAAAAAAVAPVSPALVEELIKLSPPGSPPESGRYGILAMLEHKTEQLQSLVHSMSQGCHHNGGGIQPQAAMAIARLASSISQLALALGVVPPPPPGPAFFLSEPPAAPAAQHHISLGMGSALGLFHQLNGGCVIPPPPLAVRNAAAPNDEQEAATPASPPSPPVAAAAVAAAPVEEDQEPDSQEAQQAADEGGGEGSREEEEEGGDEELTPGSYDLVEMNAMEILAEHTHFCDKCGKGFKRDANLRMHMRGHGEQYKSPAALARPATQGEGSGGSGSGGESRPRRYSCPYVGCKRNKKHRKFQPLKTVLCVKNHYRRSHCPKSLICAKCKSKKFSVVADLKTHEKHCGRDKWQCSCGTTFSRKDKLLGHITLFQGHTPAAPLDQPPSSSSSPSGAAAVAAAAADLTAFAQQQQQQQQQQH